MLLSWTEEKFDTAKFGQITHDRKQKKSTNKKSRTCMTACVFIITVFYMKTFFCGHTLKIQEKLFRCCHLAVLKLGVTSKKQTTVKQVVNHKS